VLKLATVEQQLAALSSSKELALEQPSTRKAQNTTTKKQIKKSRLKSGSSKGAKENEENFITIFKLS
tara:strand:+ start:2884 stop:3084 length:201 start_codon:yes stop_codon:yes gene_type:complete